MDISKELIAFISKEAGVKEDKVIKEARLYEDFGITGDDAIELIIHFGKKFNVDVSRFMAADYIPAEGGICGPSAKPFKIIYFQKALIFGRLDEETINRVIW